MGDPECAGAVFSVPNAAVNAAKFERQIFQVGGVIERFLRRDQILRVQMFEVLVEGVHSVIGVLRHEPRHFFGAAFRQQAGA